MLQNYTKQGFINNRQLTDNFFAAKNCYDIYTLGLPLPGIYEIPSIGRVKCLENGWTSIQHRGQYENPKDYFSKNWAEYVKGFGTLGR